jgi:hypothetical protein
MIRWFIDWTTRLNATDGLAFALVTVAVMAATGVAIAVVAELLFKALGIGAGKADRHHHH